MIHLRNQTGLSLAWTPLDIAHSRNAPGSRDEQASLECDRRSSWKCLFVDRFLRASSEYYPSALVPERRAPWTRRESRTIGCGTHWSYCLDSTRVVLWKYTLAEIGRASCRERV